MSVATAGTEGNIASGFPAIAGAGRYIAFQSDASNLSPGDTNGYYDIFLRDRETGTTKRVSLASDGSESTAGVEGSRGPAISGDARYVAFCSDAPDLVPGDTNEYDDVFLHDELTGAIERVSVASDESESDDLSQYVSISGDGRYVAFASAALNLVPDDGNECDDIFVRDRQAGTTERVSVASDGSQSDGPSYFTAISADGRYVAFASAASNLVPGDTNAQDDIFVHDRQTGVTARVSIASDGGQSDSFSYAPTISANGQYVAFASDSSVLVPGDTNGYVDIFVHDRIAGTTERVSVASDGSEGNDASYYATISANGLYVAFDSVASNLVPGDTNELVDIFRHDRYTGTTERVSVADDGAQGNGSSWGPGISGGGRDVVFDSAASNFVSADENDFSDVFVHTGEWSVFPDVPLNRWANAEIEACYEAGIVGGYSDGL
ncbi:MAG: S-layer homology domain-containing protein, partial [Armatimonadetes bacterium]|nr:S-layer homology domain-containing protein [Armatimonadota bacterium]